MLTATCKPVLADDRTKPKSEAFIVMVVSLLGPLWPQFVKENVAVSRSLLYLILWGCVHFKMVLSQCCIHAHYFVSSCTRLVCSYQWWGQAPALCSLLGCLFIQLISGEGFQQWTLLPLSCPTIKFQSFMYYWAQNCQLKSFQPEREFVGWRSLWLQGESGADISAFIW